MLGGAKPPRPSDTPPMLGGAEAALPLGGVTPSKGLLSNLPIPLLIGGKGGSALIGGREVISLTIGGKGGLARPEQSQGARHEYQYF